MILFQYISYIVSFSNIISGLQADCFFLLFVCFPGVTTHFGCIFHSPVAGFSLLVFEVS
jgi:hypothetical protein